MTSSVSNEILTKLETAIKRAKKSLLGHQEEDGHWCYELEADCTIPAEYIMMMHFLGEIDEPLQEKIALYLRRRQNDEGGWSLYYGGCTDLSCTVKAYYALKMAGDDPEAPHMLRARRTVLARGGAAKTNVFTRIALAMFGQLPWRSVPFIPVEIMLMPSWFPFHLNKVSYWSRTVMVPLFILVSLRARAQNPQAATIDELFVRPPEEVRSREFFDLPTSLSQWIYRVERVGYRLEPLIPSFVRRKAISKAENWFLARLNGVSGLGAIFPAMVNAYEALRILGYPKEDPRVKTAKEAIDQLLVQKADEAYCQPCVSPVWDTLLASCALEETGGDDAWASLRKSLKWLADRQLLDDTPGDWQAYQPHLRNGSWPFQYRNDFYPDLDDTAFAGFALKRAEDSAYEENIARAAEWLAGMQSKNGGFAAFDADNTYYYLNEIPFADHGALLDPPTSDVSARVIMFLGQIIEEYPEYRAVMNRCIEYLSEEQEADGSWFGRWGTNYIYGTWSALYAFEQAGIPTHDTRIRRAVNWLKSKQREDGGWGEDNDSYYLEYNIRGTGFNTTAVHTAWALLALMAAGEAQSESASRGVQFLLNRQAHDGLWYDKEFNAPGFPRVFYLKYHGYDKYFPLWALSRYRNENAGVLV